MDLIILGPHGAGKGTQARKISEHYGIEDISTGEIIRENIKNNTELGKKFKPYIDDNKYVPDKLVDLIVGVKLKKHKDGFVLDGYPRTLEQAKFLDRLLLELGIKLDAVINLQVNKEELVRRMIERGKREKRAEDTEEGIRSRMHEYETKAEHVIEYYRERGKVVDIDGDQPIDKVFKDIKQVLDKSEKMMERTLVIIKPDGVKENLTDEIIRRYENAGLKMVKRKVIKADVTLLRRHYSAHVKKPFYEGLEKFMMECPVVAIVFKGEDAVNKVRKITGYTDPSKAEKGTIRGDLGEDSLEKADKEGRAVRNLVHASGSKEEAEKEIKLWFG